MPLIMGVFYWFDVCYWLDYVFFISWVAAAELLAICHGRGCVIQQKHFSLTIGDTLLMSRDNSR